VGARGRPCTAGLGHGVWGGVVVSQCFDVADAREVASETARYPAADITPAQFEQFVVELLESVSPLVEGLEVALHDKIQGADGLYDFDATVRFGLGGMRFLVLIEAKRHNNPIKRELVQVLHDKLRSVGAHKAAMIATAPYQRGALEYAEKHGIALATVTEGRFTFETRSLDDATTRSQEAAVRFGLPAFVAHAYQRGEVPTSTSVTLLSTEYPEHVAESLFGVAVDHPAD
jgi:Restriction endonuclease